MQPYPLVFTPILKQTIWGGRRLGDQLGKPIGNESNYAESWEVVDHGADQSIVAEGPLAGKTLAGLITDHRDWLIGDAVSDGRFPLLLKYLDCNRVLSVQVHPDDAYGAKMIEPDLGKTEAWYIVAAEPGSLIYAGLKSGVDRADLEQAIRAGEAETVLHSFQPTIGDIVFIPAGTVHALGAGLLVAEIQQSSDTTFRLFDWNRVDVDGNERPLHLAQGMDVTDYESGPVAARRSDPSAGGLQTIVNCDKFVLQVMERETATIGGDGKFHVITVPRGSATLRWQESEKQISTGQSLLLPAAMPSCQISMEETGTVLAAHLPD
jgi:mannose-6-phosphate isomerase